MGAFYKLAPDPDPSAGLAPVPSEHASCQADSLAPPWEFQHGPDPLIPCWAPCQLCTFRQAPCASVSSSMGTVMAGL